MTHRAHPVEYVTVSGHIHIVADDGRSIPAYWSHPDMPGRFPAIALIHDAGGITPADRRLAHRYAQAGYYVIIPDWQANGGDPYTLIDATLRALETHPHTNRRVAAIGAGVGGQLAYRAAIARPDLEAAIALDADPTSCFGQFMDADTPILAIFHKDNPRVSADIIEQLRGELDGAPRLPAPPQASTRAPVEAAPAVDGTAERATVCAHEVYEIDGSAAHSTIEGQAWAHVMAFLARWIGRAHAPPLAKRFK